MSAIPEKNEKAGAKPEEKGFEWQISLRIPGALGYRMKKAHTKRNMKKSPWLIEAIEEKCKREGE